MDFLKQLEIWAKGDAFQGRIMLIAGIILAICLVYILRGNNPLLKGMLIPLGLLMVLNLGYGGFVAFSRPNHIIATTESYSQNPSETLQKEFNKSMNDHKTYSALTVAWCVLLVVSIGLFFFFSKEYYKGLSLGLMVLFLGVLLVDTFLHHRLRPYLETVESLLS